MSRFAQNRQWRCRTCDRISLEPALLTAPSPFDPDDILTGCPLCKGCDEGFAEICDEPGCTNEAGCGFPTGNGGDQWGGYRRTCSQHSKWRKTKLDKSKTSWDAKLPEAEK